MSVPARISIVTLGVDDLARSKAFYEALGWELASSVGDEICWFRTADSYLGLFGREDLAKDAALRSEPRAEFGGITMAINLESEEAVDQAIAEAVRAGAKILSPRCDWTGVCTPGTSRTPMVTLGSSPTTRASRSARTVASRSPEPLSDRGARSRCRARTAPRPDPARGSARSTSAP